MLAFRGVLAILVGAVILASPGVTLSMLLLLFATYAFVSGIVEVIAALTARNHGDDWWRMSLQGAFGIYIGILCYCERYAVPLILIFYLAVWAVLTGGLQLVGGLKVRKELEDGLRYVMSGLLALLFGLALLLIPLAGPVAIVWLVALYFIASGGILLRSTNGSTILRLRKALYPSNASKTN